MKKNFGTWLSIVRYCTVLYKPFFVPPQATRNFKKGEFVVEYAGELIDIGSAKDREAQYSLDTSKGCYMYYFTHREKQYW